jgi:hypothetical protein
MEYNGKPLRFLSYYALFTVFMIFWMSWHYNRSSLRLLRSLSLLLCALQGGILILAIEVDLGDDEDVDCELHHSTHHELQGLVLHKITITSITK